jgi:hypothetical protein
MVDIKKRKEKKIRISLRSKHRFKERKKKCFASIRYLMKVQNQNY